MSKIKWISTSRFKKARRKSQKNMDECSAGSETTTEARRHQVLMRVVAPDDIGIEADICQLIYSLDCSVWQHFLFVMAGEVTCAFLVSGTLENINSLEEHAPSFAESKKFQIYIRRTTALTNSTCQPVTGEGIKMTMRARDVEGLLWQTCTAMRENGFNIICHSGCQHLIGPCVSTETEQTAEYLQSIVIVPGEGASNLGLLGALHQIEKDRGLMYDHRELSIALGVNPSVQFKRDVFDSPYTSADHI